MRCFSRIALIACCKSKKKTAVPIPAHELYTGQLFQAQLAYVRKVLGLPYGRIFILSAQHGLISSVTTLMPYDKSLNSMRSGEYSRWCNHVVREVLSIQSSRLIFYDWIHILAGKRYQTPFSDIPHSVPHPPRCGYAQQTKWYKEQVKNHEVKTV